MIRLNARLLLLAAAARLSTACSSTPTPTPTSRASAPADVVIVAVSRSDPSPEAREALRLCLNEIIPIERVQRMGLIPSAREAVHYVPLTGREPNMRTDAPAWIVEFEGEIPMLKAGEVWVDPICVIVDGQPGYFATGTVRNLRSGAVSTREPLPRPPDRALPTLAP